MQVFASYIIFPVDNNNESVQQYQRKSNIWTSSRYPFDHFEVCRQVSLTINAYIVDISLCRNKYFWFWKKSLLFDFKFQSNSSSTEKFTHCIAFLLTIHASRQTITKCICCRCLHHHRCIKAGKRIFSFSKIMVNRRPIQKNETDHSISKRV